MKSPTRLSNAIAPSRAAVILLTLAGGFLAGCGVQDSEAEALPSEPATTDTSITVTSDEPESTQSTESTSAESEAASSPRTDIDLPEGVEPGSSAAAAWEALMAPDGEYAAFALYGAVLDKFGKVEPYASIQEAEGRHANALIRQLERMAVEVPDNPYLGAVTAPEDLETAARNWADGEVANIALYDTFLARSKVTRN